MIFSCFNKRHTLNMSEFIIPHEKQPLTRLKSNDSTQDSLFSRNPSSSSVATTLSTINCNSPTSTTPYNELKQHSPLSLQNISSPTISQLTEALHLSFSSSNVEPKQSVEGSAIAPTTTPNNELQISQKWCIILVGLPASGKSSITKNLIQVLKPHLHIDTFNAGSIRRKLSNFQEQNCQFFDFNNPLGKAQRDLYAQISLDHLLNSLFCDNLDVGILDATNSTRDRRSHIFSTIREKQHQYGDSIHINTLVLEIKCEDVKCWEYNANKKTQGPDYKEMNYQDAIKDFMERSEKYKLAFEEITQQERQENGGIFIELKNAGSQVEIFDERLEIKDEKDEVLKMIMKFINSYYEDYGKNYMELVYGLTDVADLTVTEV